MNNDKIVISDADRDRLVSSLRGMGLIQGADPEIEALTGGVSSLIVRVDDEGRSFCAKSALAKLKVSADWQVPVHRNQAEVAWMRKAARIVPAAVPDILGDDPEQNIFAMQWLDPARYPVWKQQLMDGYVSVSFAGDVGRVLGKIHAGTANDAAIAANFANQEDFDALRLDPYLRATASVHPDIADYLLAQCETNRLSQLALIHGDVSPKNILAGPEGPMLLDSECATYGDPAFDLAFCLNHLMIKAVHAPEYRDALADSFTTLVQHYVAEVDWEPADNLEARAAALLPALALARVDGKSPVEYLDESEQQTLRHIALQLINNPVTTLTQFLDIWRKYLT